MTETLTRGSIVGARRRLRGNKEPPHQFVRPRRGSGGSSREDAMRRLIVFLIVTATLAFGTTIVGEQAQAALIDNPIGLRTAADELAAVETVQFFWRGREYCWYEYGWRGPGWYWCGYRLRRGFGWGGPLGWRGWRRPVVVRPGINRPGINRPGGNRPGVNRPGANRPGVNRPGGNRPGANRPGGNRPGANRPGGNRPSANRPGGNRPGGNRPGGNRGRRRGS